MVLFKKIYKMVKTQKENNKDSESKLFVPNYAAFTVRLKFDENGHLKSFGVKSKKCPKFNWGSSGGKEEPNDNGNPEKTSQREYEEETAMEDLNPIEKYFSISRGNNQTRDGSNRLKEFVNHFFVSFQKIEPRTKPQLSQKESIEALGWFTLYEYEHLLLKQNHRLAFIELCYLLEERFPEDEILFEDLKKCAYSLFERPSDVGGVYMLKCVNGTSSFNEKVLGYVLPSNLIEGLKIEINPKG